MTGISSTLVRPCGCRLTTPDSGHETIERCGTKQCVSPLVETPASVEVKPGPPWEQRCRELETTAKLDRAFADNWQRKFEEQWTLCQQLERRVNDLTRQRDEENRLRWALGKEEAAMRAERDAALNRAQELERQVQDMEKYHQDWISLTVEGSTAARVQYLESRLASAEASSAAMRQALQQIASWDPPGYDSAANWLSAVCRRGLEANAGASLLAELAQLRVDVERLHRSNEANATGMRCNFDRVQEIAAERDMALASAQKAGAERDALVVRLSRMTIDEPIAVDAPCFRCGCAPIHAPDCDYKPVHRGRQSACCTHAGPCFDETDHFTKAHMDDAKSRAERIDKALNWTGRRTDVCKHGVQTHRQSCDECDAESERTDGAKGNAK